MDDAAMFDRLVAEAWPALSVTELGGWRLRFADGVTKRANSVWAAGEPGDVEAAIDEVERRYAALGLAPTFSISSGSLPGDLDQRLAARGYEIVDPTLVMTRPLAGAPAPALVVEALPSQEWLDLWWSVDGRGDSAALRTAAEILNGVPTAGYVRIGDGVGRGVLQGEWLGIYAMAVAPDARRRGVASRVLEALLGWGAAGGAVGAYLAVVESNAAARALYERAGFGVAGGYHYRRGR